ncbi:MULTISPECIES: type II toxin-antitoxin system prevent-host-death family antitoxin [Lactiplantibacillus]|uniref:type II toxin-antitoxin system prevent-host-death family antitoxin n=1 Tax=Lactiplantibacillus TaxID=2767842 RepID=UPI001C1FDFE6|nr:MULTISPECIES: type II toxin-antitoxin system prevent-host-death family antitoxin [Lactiplantibacillus]MBU7447915.1 type II toxin-antitoxin system prevent-host-death family antitoxin [Lactiplantibacillus sp. 7.2.4]MBU7480179.1 type II toxin-antitoxin system prevent-host-death family antitoxin [Lactiplantibacillus pentosus]MBU7502706.1 type II toxin-antitoxin system prevent-host-death family antitoxin [Lactiplantibacillus pentosus]MDY1546027.1 type II toxin-antitoxin system prevent-host-death 
MPITTTQNDFRTHLKAYLDQVTDKNQSVLVTRSNQRTVAVISQEQLTTLLTAVSANKDSLAYAVARDKLIDMQLLANDPAVDNPQAYWERLNPTNKQ